MLLPGLGIYRGEKAKLSLDVESFMPSTIFPPFSSSPFHALILALPPRPTHVVCNRSRAPQQGSKQAGRAQSRSDDPRKINKLTDCIASQHHHAYARTALFAEEIDKLAPHFGPGTGAWYVRFERHGNTQ
jgi:hypothetical protein